MGALDKYRMARGGEVVGPCLGDLYWNGVSLAIASAVYCLAFPLGPQAGTWQLSWVMLVFARNLGLMGGTFAYFHNLMYRDEAWMAAHKSGKWNPKFPKEEQHLRDRRYTIMSLCINSALECAMLHAWATGKMDASMDIGEEPLWNLGWLLVSPFWREAHFFVYHYLLHCRPLYRWFHAHHHKSYNPGPWSGLSMHPVESISYFTGPVVLAWWCRSPFVWLYANIHAEIASVYGHHGYEEYGGSYFHYLHHAKAEKNYGVGCKHALSTNDNPPTHIHAHTHTPHTPYTPHTRLHRILTPDS